MARLTFQGNDMPKFTLYSCKVRLEGNVLNEVPKDDLTVADIEMLRALHGSDAVVAIKATGKENRTNAEERARVQREFINPTLDAPPRMRAKTEMFRNLFGHDSLPMPTEMAVAGEEVEDDEEVAETAPKTPAPKITRTKAVVPEASFTE